jgi:hypothetical protein
MRRTTARRELAFVLAVAGLGLALVLIVAFAPWYTPGTGGGTGADVVRLVGDTDGSATLP